MFLNREFAVDIERMLIAFFEKICGVPTTEEFISVSILEISFFIHGHTPIIIVRANIFPFLLNAFFACILVWYFK